MQESHVNSINVQLQIIIISFVFVSVEHVLLMYSCVGRIICACLLREIDEEEKRVTQVPSSIEKLIKQGYRVQVESNAGANASFSNKVKPPNHIRNITSKSINNIYKYIIPWTK